MEHDQRICPRCGKAAGEYRFCDSCRAHIDSLTRVSSRVELRADDAAAQARQAVVRLEQALAAASEWTNDRAATGGSATAVQTEPEQAPAESPTEEPRTKQTVARFEEVMTVAPKAETVTAEDTSIAPPAGEEVASVAPPAEPVAPPAEPVASVAPPAQREAFWFELAPTLKSEGEPVEEISVAPPSATTEVDLDPVAADHENPGSPGPWLMVLFILALLTFFLGRRSARQ